MRRPKELMKREPLLWSAGTGEQVWEMFQAAIAGDVERLRPELARCHLHYRTPLYFAVRENQLEAARFLLENGAAKAGLEVGDSFLQMAQDRGFVEMEKLLIGARGRLHGASGKGQATAEAIRARDIDRVRLLLDEHPDLVNAGDGGSNQPIHWAVMTRNLEMIDLVLERGADIDAQKANGARPVQLVNGDYNYRGWRDVPEEVKTTPREVLDHLIARGAYVDICTACHMGDIGRVRELLAEDASLANRVSDYVTYYLGSGAPIKNAAARGHKEIVELLLDHGADPNLREEGIAPYGGALYSAVYNGHHDVARLLLERGAYPSPPVESSADALSIALSRKDDKMVELLASYGSHRSLELLAYYGDTMTAAAVFAANPALADDEDALRCAAGCGHEGFVRLLLRYAPELPQRTFLAEAKTKELAELLFAHGLQASSLDWLEVTPLHELAGKGNLEMAALYLEQGAELEAVDEVNRTTPLGWAAKNGKKEMVEFLLARGANPEGPGQPQWARPAAWAAARGHTEIAGLLQETAS